jgi:hypothetical protein
VEKLDVDFTGGTAVAALILLPLGCLLLKFFELLLETLSKDVDCGKVSM